MFGDFILVMFLLAQVVDGGLTYVGVRTFGLAIEGNFLLTWWMHVLGVGPALAGAKIMAALCAIALHLTAVHRILGLLTCLYLGLAIRPWTLLLF